MEQEDLLRDCKRCAAHGVCVCWGGGYPLSCLGAPFVPLATGLNWGTPWTDKEIEIIIFPRTLYVGGKNFLIGMCFFYEPSQANNRQYANPVTDCTCSLDISQTWHTEITIFKKAVCW